MFLVFFWKNSLGIFVSWRNVEVPSYCFFVGVIIDDILIETMRR